ncbi:MAG TPA: rhodanese-like domain-containing protein [Usitatibacteraceae bacterium]|jgi:rhodanese-related sulfurtransferase|nr:sulfurtransferase [Burkholderiales bacterium]HQW38008.1 rhodanese-like domain-containing protein [Usitatibacteraceae bacterium]HQY48220.1 rhodanese-like domain-containing protein [Usitatibacteraceae bacterium]HRA23926.1 rhodanese-like domain-containing protein [Usitatibacteraceae bacterium]
MKAPRTAILASLLVSAGLVLPGIAAAQKAPAAPNYPPAVSKMVGEAKKQVKTIKMDEFKAGLEQKTLGRIIDVRNENEFEDGYIPGAVNVPRGLIEFRIWKELGFPAAVDMNQRLTLYCATGGRCALATRTLGELGFTNVVSADMKFEDWVKAGNPVAKPKS